MILSIVIPAFNVEDYIVECVEALYEQELEPNDFEVIIINDGSVDSTLVKCKYLADRYLNIRVVSQDNKGQSVARNVGLEMAHGTYVFFLDSDDLLLKDSLGSFIDHIITNDLDFFGFGFIESNKRELASNHFSKTFQNVFKGSGLALIEEYDYYNGPCWFIFKKELVSDLRFISGIYCEDALFTPRLILQMNKCEVISEQVYIYFNNDKSTLREKTYQKNKKLFLDMLFVANDFDNIYREYFLSNKGQESLRIRQETFVFYSIIRFLRLHENSWVMFSELQLLSFKNYKVYPIKQFKGKNFIERILLVFINNRILFNGLNFINKYIKVIK